MSTDAMSESVYVSINWGGRWRRDQQVWSGDGKGLLDRLRLTSTSTPLQTLNSRRIQIVALLIMSLLNQNCQGK